MTPTEQILNVLRSEKRWMCRLEIVEATGLTVDEVVRHMPRIGKRQMPGRGSRAKFWIASEYFEDAAEPTEPSEESTDE